MNYLLTIVGSRKSHRTDVPTKSATTYMAQVPMNCNQDTHARVLSYILPAIIKSRPIEIKIAVSL